MNPKPRPNHRRYLEILSRMTPDEKVRIVFDLTARARALLKEAIRKRFPDLSEAELHKLYLARLDKCHNRNY